MELKRRLDLKHEPDVFVRLEKLNSLDCKMLPYGLREFVREKKLGTGSFGEVHLATRGS